MWGSTNLALCFESPGREVNVKGQWKSIPDSGLKVQGKMPDADIRSVSSNVCSSLFVVLHACLHILTHFLSLFPNYCIWTVLEIVNFLGYPLDHRKWKEDHDRTWSNCGDSKFLTGWSNWQDLEPYMWRWTIQPVLQRRLRFTVTGDIYLFKVHKEWVSLVVQSVKNLPAK